MGTAQIITHHGEGLYQVYIARDLAAIQSTMAANAARLAPAQQARAQAVAEGNAAQAQLNSLQAQAVPFANQFIQARQQILALHRSERTGEEYEAELAHWQEALDTARERLDEITAQTTEARVALGGFRSLVAQKTLEIETIVRRHNEMAAQVNAMQHDIRDAWCADYSTELTGEVPTMEINGEPGHVILCPSGTGPEDPGALTEIFTMTPAQAAFNYCIHPAWQSLKPTYRAGIVTALDHTANTAGIELDEAISHYRGADSHWQRDIDINPQGRTLTDVPVEYMDCHSAAFVEGDHVVVELRGRSWSTPVLIGFVEEPGMCCVPRIVGEGVTPWNVAEAYGDHEFLGAPADVAKWLILNRDGEALYQGVMEEIEAEEGTPPDQIWTRMIGLPNIPAQWCTVYGPLRMAAGGGQTWDWSNYQTIPQPDHVGALWRLRDHTLGDSAVFPTQPMYDEEYGGEFGPDGLPTNMPPSFTYNYHCSVTMSIQSSGGCPDQPLSGPLRLVICCGEGEEMKCPNPS